MRFTHHSNLLSLFLLIFCLFNFTKANAEIEPPGLEASAWMLIEVNSGQVLTSFRPEKKIEPASLTKILTAYVVFDALAKKQISLTQKVTISPLSASQEGSRMLLKAGSSVSIDQLLQGLIIVSGNDAAIALAEAVAGSEENFIKLMNNQAKQLGMTQSAFQNASGLPHHNHFSTVRDLSILAMAILKSFPNEYAHYYAKKEFTYQGVKQLNRNSLLFIDPSVDGIKTGHTDSAGYNLIASATREGRRLLSVVVGTSSIDKRTQYSKILIDWGFTAYKLVNIFPAGSKIANKRVWNGDKNQFSLGFANKLQIALPSDLYEKLIAQVIIAERVFAPINQNQVVGKMRISTASGKALCEVPIQAMEKVNNAWVLGRWFDQIMIKVSDAEKKIEIPLANIQERSNE